MQHLIPCLERAFTIIVLVIFLIDRIVLGSFQRQYDQIGDWTQSVSVSVIMFYVSMGRVEHGTAPILLDQDIPHHEESHDNEHSDDHGSLQTRSDVALARLVEMNTVILRTSKPTELC